MSIPILNSTSEGSFPEVRPDAESTWKNHSAPGEFREFNKFLLDLAGKSVNGYQNLLLRWAPQHFKVQLGRPRILYRDMRIPTRRKVQRLYYQAKLVGKPFAPWITVEENDLGKYPGGRYLFIAHADSEVVSIARNQLCVEQYIPPQLLGDTPEMWNKRRYRMFTPPETGVPEFGDADGDFPSDGEYRLVYFLNNGTEFSYRAPNHADKELLVKSWSMREEYRREFPPEKEAAKRYQEFEEAEQKRLAELDAQLEEEMRPYERAAEGNAFISVPDLGKD
jgi:hypothetical protein